MGGEDLYRTGGFQSVAQGGGHALALMIPVYIQPVQVAGSIHVRKAQDLSRLLRHQRVVGQKGGVSGGQIHLPVGPGVQLLRGVVPGVHSVDRVIEEPGQGGAVLTAV